MVDLMQVLEGATYAAFIAGAIFAVIELRSMKSDRKTELILRINEYFSSKDFEETMFKVREIDTKDPREIEEKVGRVAIFALVDYLDGISALAQFKLLDVKFLCYQFTWTGTWNRLEPYIKHMRQYSLRYWGSGFEWMAAEDLKWINRMGMEIMG